MSQDFEDENRWNVIWFCAGCSLNLVGVKLLTSRRGRARDLALDLGDDLGSALVAAEAPSAASDVYESPKAAGVGS